MNKKDYELIKKIAYNVGFTLENTTDNKIKAKFICLNEFLTELKKEVE